MRIGAIEIDGFGIWSGLRLGPLADGANVFFGPNEAGKSTLMQFVRGALYGYSPERRRYFPPARGGAWGGKLEASGPGGRVVVSRHLGDDGNESLIYLGIDGAPQGEHALRSLLSGIDQQIFNNVFAVGLEELQELSTLNDTDAAALLYKISVGLDRVSLIEVIRQLQAARTAVLDPADGSSQLIDLMAERDRLRKEIDGFDELTRRYSRLVAERDQVDREAVRLDEESAELASQCRLLEIALALADRWQERSSLDAQLTAFGAVERLPEGCIERLDEINAALAENQARAEEFRKQRERFRGEAEKLRVNEALWRVAPRIQALAEQEGWIGTLETRIAELREEIGGIESKLGGQAKRFNLADGEVPVVSPRSVEALQRPAAALRQAKMRLEEAQRAASAAEDNVRSLGQKITSALDERQENDLAEATERASSLVSLLRRRVQLDERLDELEQHQAELDERTDATLDRQMLPGWTLFWIGMAFIGGAILILLPFWHAWAPKYAPVAAGWPTAWFGLAIMAGSVYAKKQMERLNVRSAFDCQQQQRMLDLQVRQTQEEMEDLDQQIPRGNGPIDVRLEAAERELAALEELVPLDARRHASRQDTDSAAARAQEAEAELAAARRRWKEAVAAAGLPAGITPKQIRELAAGAEQVRDMQSRVGKRREELQQRIKDLEGIKARIAQLVKDTGLVTNEKTPVGLLRAMAAQLTDQQSRIERRRAIRLEARQVRKRAMRLDETIEQLKSRRRALLQEAAADDEQDLRRRGQRLAEVVALGRRREDLHRQIEAAMAGRCREEDIAAQLAADSPSALQGRLGQVRKRLDACQSQVRLRYEKRGQLNEQLKGLSENRTPAQRRLELAVVEKKLETTARRWQALAVTHRVLEGVRKSYEQTRQPETLREASGYFQRMTNGKYARVWTPLSDDVLLVDDAQGTAHPVERLSRGAREQLFLSLRLALVGCYARRGVELPMLLDDVLVNFDVDRAKAAATVLRDFASAHQLLIFTCHEHIARLFQSLKVEVGRLPSNGGPLEMPLEMPVKKPGRRKPRIEEPEPEPIPEPEPEPVAEVAAEPEPAPLPEPPKPVVPTPPPRPRPRRAAREVEQFSPWEEEDQEPLNGRTSSRSIVEPREEELAEVELVDEANLPSGNGTELQLQISKRKPQISNLKFEI